MDEHRFRSQLPPGPSVDGLKFTVVQSPTSQLPLQPIDPFAIYQAAYEKAKRDHQLDRLFNPDFYEEGGGI